MKSITLFCTKMRFFLGEIPIIFLLVVSIIHNGDYDGPMKLYPLIIFCIAAASFIVIYFFRAVRISYSEIKDIGRFSERNIAIINAGKTIILKLKKRSTVLVELFGNDGMPPLYSPEDESTEPIDINLFRGRVIGGRRAIKRVLKFFGADDNAARELIASECSFEYENVNITSGNEDGGLEIYIFMKNTV